MIFEKPINQHLKNKTFLLVFLLNFSFIQHAIASKACEVVRVKLADFDRPIEWYAKKAGLVYLKDGAEGYIRKVLKNGHGYYFNGKRITDEKKLAWFQSLKISPEPEDVWISKNPKSHILAKIIDEAERTQYVYHPKWIKVRSQHKFQKIGVFGLALSYARAHYKSDSRLGDLSKEQAHGLATWLMDLTSIRVGSEVYAKQNLTYGITTLEKKHIKIRGNKITLQFTGKSSQEHAIEVKNASLAALLKKLMKLPGDQLFQYKDSDTIRDVTSISLNDYIEQITLGPFTAKEFRTWKATSEAMKILIKKQPPKTEAELKKIKNEVYEKVAAVLGNTPTTTKNSYVYPEIFSHFMDGSLPDFVRQGRDEGFSSLSISERATVAMFDYTN